MCYTDDCNIYVQSRRAGERVLERLERYLRDRLRLTIHRAKSAVDRPWNRKFLGYSVTWHRTPKLKVATESVRRLKQKLRETFRRGRGRNMGRLIRDLTPQLRGWAAYYRLSEVKGGGGVYVGHGEHSAGHGPGPLHCPARRLGAPR